MTVLTTAEHERRLERGWVWLAEHDDDPRKDAYFERWLGWLREYTAHEASQNTSQQVAIDELLLPPIERKIDRHAL